MENKQPWYFNITHIADYIIWLLMYVCYFQFIVNINWKNQTEHTLK